MSRKTRDTILDCAIRAFSKHGFSASIQEVADLSGISQAAVFYHFPNRQALIKAVLVRIREHNHALVEAQMRIGDDANTRLFKHFSGNLLWGLKHHDEAQVLLLLYYLGCQNRELSKLYWEMLKRARGRIEEYLLAGTREGLYKLKLSSADTSEALHNLLLGAFVNMLSTHLADQGPSVARKLNLIEGKLRKSASLITGYRIKAF